eukprot:TRINITY_DN7085_c0_g1_i2.p1 TRINITY_DN7085_c0_g1~~TRINITY_DN7085_c0_g1_i2.p1  ORF type:complete len:1076 (-),score=375.91 TRINITY_DN7085_c0_g1_i2:142-3369(-)
MVNVRRCELSDAGAATQLADNNANQLEDRFGGPFRLSSHIELSGLCTCAVDDADEQMLGLASFSDHPPVAAEKVPPAQWEEWTRERFPDLKDVTPYNSVWLSVLLTSSEQQAESTKQLLKSMFSTLSQMDSCMLCLPASVPLWAPVSDFFVKLEPVYEVPFCVFRCDREQLVPSLKIRLAQVEDHDDLIPVLNAQTELHTDVHGEFFLAEVIEGQDATRKCIVAEADGRAVGLIALSTEIDIELLNQCHDLAPWGYLCDEVQEEVSPEELEVAGFDALHAAELGAQPDSEEGSQPDESRIGSAASVAFDKENEASSTEEQLEGAEEAGEEGTGEAEDEECQAADEPPEAQPTTRTVHVPNCFAITMFCLDKKYQCRTKDFLAPLFHVFGQQLSHCLLTVPHTESESALMPFMTHVKPRSESTFPHSLYLLHRDTLQAPPRVRPTSVGDMDGIQTLLDALEEQAQRHVSNTVKDDINGLNAGVKVYSVMQGLRLVGVLGLDQLVTAEQVKAEYQLEEMLALHEHAPPASLRYLVLTSVVEPHAQFVLTDAMRHAGLSLVCCLTGRDSMPPLVLAHFLQPLPRRLVQRAPELHQDSCETRTLHVFAKRLLCEPKSFINARVVVVGASDTGLGFIESLLSVPYLHFTNLTLLSKDGMPQELDKPFAPCSHSFAPCEVEKLGIGLKANVLQQTMVGLDRAAKLIKLDSGSELPYDYLVLAVGVQDQVARQLVQADEQLEGQVVSVSCSDDMQHLVEALGEQASSTEAVVYGAGLEVYCAAQGLIAHGVPPSQLKIVLATDEGNPEAARFMEQHRVEDRVRASLRAQGLKSSQGHIQGVNTDEQGNLNSVVIKGLDGEEDTLRCNLMLCCATPDIDMDAFNAVNDQSLIYDGALVVDGRFRTNDSTIFAAGPVVKHKRTLRAKIPTRCYNSREVGNRLAACVLPVLDPASAFELDHPLALEPYHRPKAIGGTLPGGDTLFVVQSPQAMHSRKRVPHARELVTDKPGQCSRILLDQHAHVAGLFHYGQAVEHQNWLALYGLPETAINRLASRYDEGIISELAAFLREEWAMALYHLSLIHI